MEEARLTVASLQGERGVLEKVICFPRLQLPHWLMLAKVVGELRTRKDAVEEKCIVQQVHLEEEAKRLGAARAKVKPEPEVEYLR